MAKADNALQEYWDDEEKFADLFNATLFDGEKVILPEKLLELDSRGNMGASGERKKKSGSVSMYRDLVKVAKIYQEYGVELVILGLENQEHIHYAMPMRVMGYDYSEYKKQYRKNARKYKKTPKGLTSDEFLSKMKRFDKFHPVITIVMYYGEKTWDGARTLHEMLDISEKIKPFVNDYSVHLIEVKKNNLPLQNEKNQDLFKLCSIVLDTGKADEQKRKEAIQYEKEHKIDEEVLHVLAEVTNHELPKENEENKKGAMTMCTFFDHLVEQGIEQGIEQGVISQTLKKISKNVSPEQTADMLEADIDTIRQIYRIKASNPQYSEREIYKAMQAGKQ